MRELIKAKYCMEFDLQKSMDGDLECEKCYAYKACLEEPNPYKCDQLIFLMWWKDEVHLLEENTSD